MPKRKRADLPQVRQRKAAATYQRPRGYLTLWVSAVFNGSTSLENGMENIGNDAASSGEPSEWHSIDWRAVMQFVGKAQMRIAQAEQEKDFRRVARLTRSLIRSRQAKALAVRKVTENQGKRTSGVDCVLWDTPTKKWNAIGCLNPKGYRARP